MLVAGLAFALAHHLGWRVSLPWVCPFRALTGVPCPGCGLTDATRALALGHLREAAHLNPNVFPLWLWVLAAALVPRRAALRLGGVVRRARLFELWLLLALGWWLLVRLPGALP